LPELTCTQVKGKQNGGVQNVSKGFGRWKKILVWLGEPQRSVRKISDFHLVR
jgi:hypothetical protein